MKFKVIDSVDVKMVSSPDYNFSFNKKSGFFARWGKTRDEDPVMAPAPEILDLEISYGGKCMGNCKFCSPAGTLVSTPDGNIKIEDLKENDLVISYDEEKKCPKINTIHETYKRYYCGDLIELELENGKELKLTPEHLVFVQGIGWIQAKFLKPDMEIINF